MDPKRMFWLYFFNPQLVHKVLNLKLSEAMLFCYISYWRFWYEVFSVGWLSAQLGGKPEIWMGSFLVSQGPRIPPDNAACWGRELGIVSVVSCCALSCSCLVTQAYFIPLFVLFYLLKLNSEDCWRDHMLLGVIDFSWLNVQHCSFLLVSGKTLSHFFHCAYSNYKIACCNYPHAFWGKNPFGN